MLLDLSVINVVCSFAKQRLRKFTLQKQNNLNIITRFYIHMYVGHKCIFLDIINIITYSCIFITIIITIFIIRVIIDKIPMVDPLLHQLLLHT